MDAPKGPKLNQDESTLLLVAFWGGSTSFSDTPTATQIVDVAGVCVCVFPEI